MKLTRKEAIKILCRISDQDDPYWEYVTEDHYDEDTDEMPTIYDVFDAIGVSRQEVDEAQGPVYQ